MTDRLGPSGHTGELRHCDVSKSQRNPMKERCRLPMGHVGPHHWDLSAPPATVAPARDEGSPSLRAHAMRAHARRVLDHFDATPHLWALVALVYSFVMLFAVVVIANVAHR